MARNGHTQSGTRETIALGCAIRAARENAGYTTNELAALVSRCQRLIPYWEAGLREPGIKDMCRVAAACGVRLSQLLAPLDTLDTST